VSLAADQRRVARQHRSGHAAGRLLGAAHRQAERQRAWCWRSSTPSPFNRRTAKAVFGRPHPADRLQKPPLLRRREPADRDAAAARRAVLPIPFPPRRRRTPTSIPSRREKRSTSNYASQEDVNGLTTYRFTQNVGYNADGNDGGARGVRVACTRATMTARSPRPRRCGACRAITGRPGHHDPLLAAPRTSGWTLCREPSSRRPSTPTTTSHRGSAQAGGDDCRLPGHLHEDTVESQVNAARDERDRAGAVVASAADHVHRGRLDRADRRRNSASFSLRTRAR